MEGFYVSLFSQTLLGSFRGEKKANCHCFYVETACYFEKRATNLIRIRKIAITTLKSAFGF